MSMEASEAAAVSEKTVDQNLQSLFTDGSITTNVQLFPSGGNCLMTVYPEGLKFSVGSERTGDPKNLKAYWPDVRNLKNQILKKRQFFLDIEGKRYKAILDRRFKQPVKLSKILDQLPEEAYADACPKCGGALTAHPCPTCGAASFALRRSKKSKAILKISGLVLAMVGCIALCFLAGEGYEGLVYPGIFGASMAIMMLAFQLGQIIKSHW